MEPGQTKRGATEAPPGEVRLTELADGIRAGIPGAAEELYGALYAGVRFLIQRRVGSTNVDRQVRSLLDAVVQSVQEDASAGSVITLVRQLIARRFPAGSSQPAEAPTAGGHGVEAAARVLEQMSPRERDALRRCYVLGEARESLLKALNLTPEEFRAIQLRARAEFNARGSRRSDVA
jgi:hypothetical protein